MIDNTTISHSEGLSRGRRMRNAWLAGVLGFLVVMGPGLIVMEADNDAGAVATYTQAGAQYGYDMLWLLLLLLPITYFMQEMVVRLGIATGKGHAAMIYQRFGPWWGLFSFLDLQIVNFLTLVTEFAAIDLALDRLGVAPLLGVPLSALGLILLVSTGSYRRWERIVVALCLLDVVWVVLAITTHPDVAALTRAALVPGIPGGHMNVSMVMLVIAVVGTTIAPWQLFFQQSCIADKRLSFANLRFARLDTFLGACFTILIAGAMMVVGADLYRHGGVFTDSAALAVELGHWHGAWFRDFLLVLMINAAVLGGTAISLSSAWAYGEVRGVRHSLESRPKDAPGFYGVYVLCVAAAAAIVLLPQMPLQLIIIGVQVLSGIVLPSAIVFLQLLLNDREVLGEQFVNRPWNNWVNWTIVALLFALSFVLALQVAAPGLISAG